MKKALVLALFALGCQQKEAPIASAPAPAPAAEAAAAPLSAVAADAPILEPMTIANPAARDVYAKAQQVPDRLSKLYCYCHCHQHLGHASLKTCFQTDHAEECQVCQREAVQAWMDWKQGLPVEATQRAADQEFNGGLAPPPGL